MNDQPNLELSIRASEYFTPNAPIDEREMFSGRSNQILSVLDAVNQKGQHAMLYGERGVGKTSLTAVLSQFLDGGPILCPRVNCENTDTFASVFVKLFSEIRLTRKRSVPGFSDSIALVSSSACELFQAEATPNGVRRVLTHLSESAVPILIVDEFDRLPANTKGVFADMVKMLSDHAVRATVVLVGVADSVDELIAEHESVERALFQIRLPRMSEGEISDIVSHGVEKLELRIDPEAEKRIVLLSQGLPHYAHLLGLHSVRAAAQRRTPGSISVQDVDRAIRTALDSAQQSLRNAFHRATTSPRADNLYQHVLCACAVADIDELGYFAAADVRAPMREITGRNYGIPAFARHLNEFCRERRGKVLQKIGTPRRYRFRFRNPLMQPYTIMNGLDSGLLATPFGHHSS